jgi:putative phage-type endonuclease
MSAVLQEVGADYERKRYLGSSDIAGVLGISPWATPLTVWQRKTQHHEPETKSGKKKLFSRGQRWESVVAEMLVAELEAREHKVTVLNANKRYADPEFSYMAAEIDFEIRLDDIPDVVNVELKTVHPNASKYWGESDDSDVYPLYYMAQAMFGLMVTQRQCCVLAPMFGADEIRVYPIIRDDETIAGMREQARLFWELYVLTGTPPDPRTLADVNSLFRQDAGISTMAEPYIVDKLLRYRATDAEVAAREAERDVLEFEIKTFMRDATGLIIPGQEKPAVTWKTQKTSRFQLDAFKAEYPKMVKQFSKDSTSRVFRMSQFDFPDIPKESQS